MVASSNYLLFTSLSLDISPWTVSLPVVQWAELQQPPPTELSEGGADKIGDFAAESLQVSPR